MCPNLTDLSTEKLSPQGEGSIAQNMRQEYRDVGDIYSSHFFANIAAAENESLTQQNDSGFIQYKTFKCDRHELSCQS